MCLPIPAWYYYYRSKQPGTLAWGELASKRGQAAPPPPPPHFFFWPTSRSRSTASSVGHGGVAPSQCGILNKLSLSFFSAAAAAAADPSPSPSLDAAAGLTAGVPGLSPFVYGKWQRRGGRMQSDIL